MSSTTTQTTIANRALQLLGYQSIGSLNDNDRGARAVLRAYPSVLLDALRSNYWGFSIRRIILAASATAPAFGKAFYYPLPGDFIAIAPPDQSTNYTFNAIPVGNVPTSPNSAQMYEDWAIEGFPSGGLAISSSMTSPIYLRYTSSNVTESQFDPSFAEAFAADLAEEMCEELTQSNTKKTDLEKVKQAAMDQARKRNAFEILPVQPPIDSWLLVRM